MSQESEKQYTNKAGVILMPLSSSCISNSGVRVLLHVWGWGWGNSHSPGYPQTHYVATDDLEFLILHLCPLSARTTMYTTMPHLHGSWDWIQGFVHFRQRFPN